MGTASLHSLLGCILTPRHLDFLAGKNFGTRNCEHNNFFSSNSISSGIFIHQETKLVHPLKAMLVCDSSSAPPPLAACLRESVSVSTPQRCCPYSLQHYSQQPTYGTVQASSADGRIQKMWFKLTVEFYSVIKTNETMLL